jgi:hypothetical protein
MGFMRPWFFRSLRSTRAAESPPRPGAAATAAGQSESLSAVAYPPCDPGLPVQGAQALLRDQRELMSMLRLHAALPPAVFESRFGQAVARVAGYVNVLPGSASAGFAGAGGLFRASLETAFTCFRASDGRIFTGALEVEERHRLEGRWRYLCFAAGLLFPLGGALGNMAVTDPHGATWSPELEPVTAFAAARQAGQLFVGWICEEPRLGPAPLTASFGLDLIGRDTVDWLNRGSPALVRALLEIVTGAPAKGLVAAGLVREMWQAVYARETVRRHQNYGRLTIGSCVAPYLLDAMVGLARSTWSLDDRTLHADTAGVYLEWPEAGRDIIDFCRRKAYTGVPDTEAALLAILTSTGLVEPGIDGTALVPFVDRRGGSRVGVVVSQPGLLLEDGPPGPPSSSRPAASGPAAIGGAAPAAGTGARSAPPATPRQKPATKRPVPKPPPVLLQTELLLTVAPPEAGEGESGSAQDIGADTDADMDPDGPAGSVDAHAAEGLVDMPPERPADVLPADLRSRLSPEHGELLGRLVHLWRARGTGRNAMRPCEQGAAFEFALLRQFTPDPTLFLTRLGELGLLFVSPQTTGKMIYPVTMADGERDAVSCFILAPHAMRRLGLQ